MRSRHHTWRPPTAPSRPMTRHQVCLQRRHALALLSAPPPGQYHDLTQHQSTHAGLLGSLVFLNSHEHVAARACACKWLACSEPFPTASSPLLGKVSCSTGVGIHKHVAEHRSATSCAVCRGRQCCKREAVIPINAADRAAAAHGTRCIVRLQPGHSSTCTLTSTLCQIHSHAVNTQATQ